MGSGAYQGRGLEIPAAREVGAVEEQMCWCRTMKRGRVFVVSTTMVLVGAGCTPTLIALDKGNLLRLRDADVIRVVHYSPAAFTVMTPGKASLAGFGLIGGLVAAGLAKAQAEEMERDFALTDPATTLSERLLAGVSGDLGLTRFQAVDTRLDSDDLEELAARCRRDLVMDFRTDHWMLSYFPFDWSRYRVSYAARARLVRPHDARTLWLGYCKVVEETGASWDEITLNAGALLKAKFADAATDCARQLLVHLKTGAPPDK
jgi:hypothetical protein